ncbi:MAG TPA: CCA tRNA nucleotidyltransferase [Actinomycetota bacterium]|nr:CCA tRNA nucleotidyltransferase [Actinomycetota bacterium]
MAPSDERDLLHIPPIASELGTRFEKAGHELYLVGGAVRDAVRGRAGTEMDFATDAHPQDVIKLLQGWADARYLVGVRFGTVGARKGEAVLEITTFREEVYAEDSRHPVVTFAKDVETDLARRDFTINAMAVRLPDGELVDPHRGLYDLAHQRLRTPLGPEMAFTEDPLRMLRAARFVSTLGMVPEADVVEAMRALRERLRIVSAERIRDELSKLLRGEHVDRGLELVVDTGLADVFLPELPALRLEQDPVHRHKDVLRHTLAVVKRCPSEDEEEHPTLRLAALLHDTGKPDTRRITPEGVQFHHHEVVGARIAEDRLRALRYPERVVHDVKALVEMHLRFHTYRLGWSDGALRRYVRDAGPLLDKLNLLTRADCTTQNPRKAKVLSELQDDLEQRIAKLAEEENLRAIRPPLDGNQVMEHLEVEPGPVVGQALSYLLELRMDRGPIDEEEAYRLLDDWWEQRGGR